MQTPSTLCLATVIALSIAPVEAMTAQTRIIDKGTTGVRESARLLDRAPRSAVTGLLLVPEATSKLLLIPSAVSADGLAALGATVGFINVSRFSSLPFQFTAGYRRLALTDADDHDRIALDGKIRVLKRNTIAGRTTSVSVLGGFERTLGLESDFEATAALEQALDTIGAWSLGVTTSLLHSRVDEANATTAFGAAAGIVYAIGDQTEFDLDYQFKNGIDGEDDYSFTVVQLLTKVEARTGMSLVVGVSKHRTVYATVVLVR